MMKQQKLEPDDAHMKRLKEHMLLLSDEQFINLGHLIDPDDEDQTSFLVFYNDIQKLRVAILERNTKKKSKACEIF